MAKSDTPLNGHLSAKTNLTRFAAFLAGVAVSVIHVDKTIPA
jgi:hypothetical protein